MNKKALTKELINNILNNNFKAAMNIVEMLPFKIIENAISEAAYDTNNISFYTFVVALLLKKETVEFHVLASTLLSFSICFLQGAYITALYHARKCVELESENIEYKQFLLFFHDIPDRLVSAKEAIKIAFEILQEQPDSIVANNILQAYEKKDT